MVQDVNPQVLQSNTPAIANMIHASSRSPSDRAICFMTSLLDQYNSNP